MTKLMPRLPLMAMKNKWQIASHAKQGCSENPNLSMPDIFFKDCVF